MHEEVDPVAQSALQFKPENLPRSPAQIEVEAEAARLADQKVGLHMLRRPFQDEEIETLPRYAGSAPRGSRKRGRCGFCEGFHELPAVHLSYVGHAQATDRLLSVDSLWNWEPVAEDSHGLPLMDLDANGNAVGFWIRLTVCGLSRLGYGSCDPDAREAVKELIGDAIRNALMRFGGALELWKKGDRDVGYVDETGSHRGKPTAARSQDAVASRPQEPADQDESGDPVVYTCVSCGTDTARHKARVFAAAKETPKWDVQVKDPIYKCSGCGQFVPARQAIQRQTDEPQGDEDKGLPF